MMAATLFRYGRKVAGGKSVRWIVTLLLSVVGFQCVVWGCVGIAKRDCFRAWTQKPPKGKATAALRLNQHRYIICDLTIKGHPETQRRTGRFMYLFLVGLYCGC